MLSISKNEMYLYIISSLSIVSLLILNQQDYWKEKSKLNLQFKREIVVIFLIASLSTLSIHLHKEKETDSIAFEIGSKSNSEVDQINFIDRNFTGQWDISFKDKGKLILNISIYILPLSLFLFRGSIKERISLFFIYCQGYIFTESITGITKGLVNRYRPFVYRKLENIDQLNPDSKSEFLEDIASTDITNSFFSGDASTATFGFIFFAMCYHLFYSEDKLKKIVWTFAIIGTALECYFRTMSGKHFPSDVIMGAIVGSLIVYGIIRIHLTNSN